MKNFMIFYEFIHMTLVFHSFITLAWKIKVLVWMIYAFVLWILMDFCMEIFFGFLWPFEKRKFKVNFKKLSFEWKNRQSCTKIRIKFFSIDQSRSKLSKNLLTNFLFTSCKLIQQITAILCYNEISMEMF